MYESVRVKYLISDSQRIRKLCAFIVPSRAIFLKAAYQVGRPLVPRGFVKCFRRVPRLLGCTAAAMLPKQARGTFRKHTTKPSEQVAAPPGSPRAELVMYVVNVGFRELTVRLNPSAG